MKYTPLILILTLISCQTIQTYTFDKILYEFQNLDKTANTNWRQEKIEGKTIPKESIQNYLQDLQKLKNKLPKEAKYDATKDNANNSKLLHDLIQARTEMLKSQESYYQTLQILPETPLSYKFDKNGALIITQPIDCKKKEQYEESLKYNTEILQHYQTFINLMDNILQYSKTAEKEFGISDNRLPFYTPPLELGQRGLALKRALSLFCN